MDGSTPRWRPADYGELNAAWYDQIYPRLDPRIVPLLCRLADNQMILELGVGSGRLALPLRDRGQWVLGVDASPAMLRRLRDRDLARRCTLLRADLARLPLRAASVGLAVALADTLSLLPARSAQQACLDGIAAALTPAGALVYEGCDAAAAAPDPDLVQWQAIDWQGACPGVYRFPQLALPPTVMDAMAQSAGLRLQARWADWSQREWRCGDPQVISIYGH